MENMQTVNTNKNIDGVKELLKIEKANSNKKMYFFLKRTFDIFGALFGMIFLIPLMLIVKISYILTGDWENIFYIQKRIGKNGSKFYMYKFRTMVPQAERKLNSLLRKDKKLAEEYKKNKKLENDPRITTMGKILRKTSLDELPQLICILEGKMSIIGNRPYMLREKNDMGEYFKDIVRTKPGLTGLWQVSGRNSISFEERLKLEQYYSNNCSIKLDIKIFFKTFLSVIKKKGAM